MSEDITEKLITLTSAKGAIFTGTRIKKDNGSYSENWKCSYNGSSGSIPAAYVSKGELSSIQSKYSDYLSSQEKTEPEYRKKLESLIRSGRKENYEGKTGYLVRIIKKPNGYYLNAFEIVKREVKSKLEEPDFEEMAFQAVEDELGLKPIKKPEPEYAAGKKSNAENYNKKPVSKTPESTGDTTRLPVLNAEKPKADPKESYKPKTQTQTKPEDPRKKTLAKPFNTQDSSKAANDALKKGLKKA
ncbi:Uncharacterised protein [uncultured archaeon]|nr:Uncharacterised protein [uncultured archaeon]